MRYIVFKIIKTSVVPYILHSFFKHSEKNLIESKKMICYNDFLWFKEMICLNEIKFV